jgi:antitoxin VapB
MTKEYRAKTFKSGNSVALRIPKSLGLKEGDDVVIVAHHDGSFSFWPESDGAKILDGLYGAFSPGFMSAGRGDIEQDERDWAGPPQDEAA